MSDKGKEKRRAEFMADVSHDLKTPLNAVIGFTSVLLQEREQLGGERTRQLELVYKSAQRLLQRLDALVEFFRLQADGGGFEVDWFSPTQLIVQIFDQLRDTAEQQEVELKIGPGPLPARMLSGPKLVYRVLRELVANAVAATRGGAVTVELLTRPSDRPGALRMALSVEDQGVGLGAESLARLLAALGPSAQSEEASFEGLGLGLALARQAAWKLGGWIEAASRSEQGSTFTLVFELPESGVQT